MSCRPVVLTRVNFAGSGRGIRLFHRAADALFELVDGICSPIEVGGVAHVSLAPGGRGAAMAPTMWRCRQVGSTRTWCDVLAAARPASWLPDSAVGYDDVDALQRRVFTAARLLRSPVAALGRAADRGRLVLLLTGRVVRRRGFVDDAAGLPSAAVRSSQGSSQAAGRQRTWTDD
jgi:hypothetical protein